MEPPAEETETDSDSDVDVATESESESDSETESDSDSETESETDSESDSETETDPAPPGTLPPPGSNPDWMWIRLKSGETFGGTLFAMHDGGIELTSGEVGLRTFSFSKVHELVSTRPITVVTVERESHTGPAEMRDGETLVIHTDGGDVSIPRAQILGFDSAGSHERDHWYFKYTFGFTLTEATTDQITISSVTRVRRDDGLTRLTLNHDYNYAIATDAMDVDTTTAHNMASLLKLDVFLTKRFYLTPALAKLGFDLQQNIDLRAVAGAGFGAHLLTDNPTLDVELTGLYQFASFDSAPMGGTENVHGGGGGYRVHFKWTIVPGHLAFDFEHAGDVIYAPVIGVTSVLGQSNFRTTAALDIDLFSVFSLDLNFTWSRVVEPAPDGLGNRPEPDTFTFVVGLGVELGR